MWRWILVISIFTICCNICAAFDQPKTFEIQHETSLLASFTAGLSECFQSLYDGLFNLLVHYLIPFCQRVFELWRSYTWRPFCSLFRLVLDAFTAAWNILESPVRLALTTLSDALTAFGRTLSWILTELWNLIAAVCTPICRTFARLAQSLFSAVRSLASGLYSVLECVATRIYTMALTLHDLNQSVSDSFLSLVDRLLSYLAGPFEWLSEIRTSLLLRLTSLVSRAYHHLLSICYDPVVGAFNWISQALISLLEYLFELMLRPICRAIYAAIQFLLGFPLDSLAWAHEQVATFLHAVFWNGDLLLKDGFGMGLFPHVYRSYDRFLLFNNVTYSVHLVNRNDYATDCLLTIDGILAGQFRLQPKGNYYLHRPAVVDKKFYYMVAAPEEAQANPDIGRMTLTCLSTEGVDSLPERLQTEWDELRQADCNAPAGRQLTQVRKDHSGTISSYGSSIGKGTYVVVENIGQTVLKDEATQQEVREITPLNNPSLTKYTKLEAKLSAIADHTLRTYVRANMLSAVVMVFIFQLAWLVFSCCCCCCCCRTSGDPELAKKEKELEIDPAELPAERARKKKNTLATYFFTSLVMYMFFYCLLVTMDPAAVD